jgi:hypothetical protein
MPRVGRYGLYVPAPGGDQTPPTTPGRRVLVALRLQLLYFHGHAARPLAGPTALLTLAGVEGSEDGRETQPPASQ